MNPGFVVAMGIVTVFVGLIVLIVLCNLLGRICSILEKVEQKMDTVPQAAPAAAPVATTAATTAPADGGIANRQEFIAAVSAVIAEEMGTDVSAIRILSVKKIG